MVKRTKNIFILILLVLLVNQASWPQEKSYIINFSAGSNGLGIGYEKVFGDIKYNVNLGFLGSAGLFGNLLYKLNDGSGGLNQYAVFSAGASISSWGEDKRFFSFHRDTETKNKKFGSVFCGLAYQAEWKNFYITPGAAIGTGLYKYPKFILTIGYTLVF